MVNAIETHDLTKHYRARVREAGFKAAVSALIKPEYREVTAVGGITMSVPKGQVLAFIGPNGAGKSTMIKMLTGILHPTSGSASVLGYDPQKQRVSLAYRIGAMFGQKSQLMMHLPAKDSMRLLGAVYDVDRAVCEERIASLTRAFGVDDLLTTPVRKLSLGQRIRLELAASLLHEPEILFLDEPTIGLDVVVKSAIRDMIKALNREKGTTVFLTSHDVGDIEALCSRAVVIDNGAIVTDQPVDALRAGYMSKKRISVVFDREGVEPSLPGVSALSREGVKLRLEADTRLMPIDETVTRLFAMGGVTDITVEDEPLENIIKSIFQSGGGGRLRS